MNSSVRNYMILVVVVAFLALFVTVPLTRYQAMRNAEAHGMSFGELQQIRQMSVNLDTFVDTDEMKTEWPEGWARVQAGELSTEDFSREAKRRVIQRRRNQ